MLKHLMNGLVSLLFLLGVVVASFGFVGGSVAVVVGEYKIAIVLWGCFIVAVSFTSWLEEASA